MRPRRPHATRPGVAARLLVVAGFALAGCSSPASAADRDPAELLAAAAATLYAEQASAIDLNTSVRIVQGEESDETVASYRFARFGEAKFAFDSVFEEGEGARDGVFARSDGEILLTHIRAMGKYTLEENGEGIAAFVQSPFSQGVGNPLGGLGLSLLHPATTAEMVGRLTSSEYVGEETLGETVVDRCRYTVEGQVTFDVWFSQGEAPRALRLESDLSEAMAAGAPGGGELEYVVRFDYAEAEGPAPSEADFALVAPEGAELVESFFRRSGTAPHRLLGREAPAFELTGLEGEPVSLGEHLGKDVVVLDFWATWCPPCVAALPTLDRVTESFAEEGVVFYAIDQGESIETVTAFLEQRELSPPVLMDAEGSAATAYDVEGLPTSVLIGRDGTVQVVHVGFSQNLEARLTEELEALVGGEDLASEKVEAYLEEQRLRGERLKRLRARIADPT